MTDKEYKEVNQKLFQATQNIGVISSNLDKLISMVGTIYVGLEQEEMPSQALDAIYGINLALREIREIAEDNVVEIFNLCDCEMLLKEHYEEHRKQNIENVMKRSGD